MLAQGRRRCAIIKLTLVQRLVLAIGTGRTCLIHMNSIVPNNDLSRVTLQLTRYVV